jgi:hypothetical protein
LLFGLDTGSGLAEGLVGAMGWEGMGNVGLRRRGDSFLDAGPWGIGLRCGRVGSERPRDLHFMLVLGFR